jgi:hypothetical protein
MHGAESDVSADPHVARAREGGGLDPDEREPGGPGPGSARPDRDAEATTGSGRNEEYVGRAAGQDAGYTGETGAEARAEAGEA